MERKYTLIIELENGEEVIHATTNTADDVFNLVRIGDAKADQREDELLVEAYDQLGVPLYESIDDAD